jgi:hypothetical protein
VLVAAAPPFSFELSHWAFSYFRRITCPCLGAGWFEMEGLANVAVDYKKIRQ